YEAAQDINRQMTTRAAQIWEVKPEDVTHEDGVFQCRSDSKKRLTFKELAGKLHATGGTIVGRASVDPPGVGGAFSTQIADVEVARFADDRHGDCRSAESRASLRRPWRRRSADCSAARCGRERHFPGRRRPHAGAADVAGTGGEGDPRQVQDVIDCVSPSAR